MSVELGMCLRPTVIGSESTSHRIMDLDSGDRERSLFWHVIAILHFD